MAEITREMTEAESFRKGIFPYSIGGVRAIVDPLKCLNWMYEVLPKFDEVVARFFAPIAEDADPETRARHGVEMVGAALALEPAVLAGFKLQPLGEDGSGVSVTECMDLLAEFLGWQDRREAARQAAEDFGPKRWPRPRRTPGRPSKPPSSPTRARRPPMRPDDQTSDPPRMVPEHHH
jgi:hypothetical protein